MIIYFFDLYDNLVNLFLLVNHFMITYVFCYRMNSSFFGFDLFRSCFYAFSILYVYDKVYLFIRFVRFDLYHVIEFFGYRHGFILRFKNLKIDSFHTDDVSWMVFTFVILRLNL
jgi:hypothetical protein